jgi:hypothetical protein
MSRARAPSRLPRSPIALALLAALAVAPCAHAQFLFGRLVPLPPETQANNNSQSVTVSRDGRVFAFSSGATNWVPGSITGDKIIVVDFAQNVVQNLSTNSSNVALNGNSFSPSIAGNGRYVVFETFASNLGITSSGFQIVRKDRQTGQLVVASTNASGQAATGSGSGQARDASVSADGRFVVFRSDATNLITGSGGNGHVYVKDLQTGAIELVSQTTSGGFPTTGVSASTVHSMSADGRYVVFQTNAANIASGVPGGTIQVYVRDRQTGTTELVSRGPGGVVGNGQSDFAAISPNGRFVSFRSFATNLGSTLTTSRVFVRDRQAGTTTLVPLPVVNAQTASGCRESDVADDGSVVYACFFSSIFDQVFLHVPGAPGTPFHVSTGSGGTPGNNVSGASVAIDASGRSLAFQSLASNLVPGDTNNVNDIFILSDAAILDGLFADGFE